MWDDGEIFVATKDNHTVVSINGYVGVYYVWTGQIQDVLHNAILCLYNAPPSPPVSVPLSNWAIYFGIFLIFVFTDVYFKKHF